LVVCSTSLTGFRESKNSSDSGFATSSEGKRLVYLADQDVDEDSELYLIDLEASGSSVRLNPPLPPGGDIIEFSLFPQAGA
jgi:hypothetical protein